jgi:hypothetical protein
VPPLGVLLRLIVKPAHTGLLELAVTVGFGFTVTEVVAVPEHPLSSVTVTLYVPLIDSVALVRVGF